jgi:hypothetical protein
VTPGYELALEQFHELEALLDDALVELSLAQERVDDLWHETNEARTAVDRAKVYTSVCPVCNAAVDEPCNLEGNWTHTARTSAAYKRKETA